MGGDEGELFASRRVASCRDVEHARRALSDVFLPVDFPSARASSRVDLKLNALTVGRVTCGYMRFNDALRLETAEAEHYHIDIPTAGRATMRAGLGQSIYATPRKAGVFMPGRPVAIDTGERFAQLSLMIPRDQLNLEAENLLGIALTHPLEFSGEMDLDVPGGQVVMQVLRTIDKASEHPDGGLLAHPLAAQRLEQVLLHTLLLDQQHNLSAALVSPAPAAGMRPVAQAVELLRNDPSRPWTVTELATEVSVSVRSLQEGFRRSLDTTPMAYLRQLRLEKVHQALANAEPGSLTVTEIAAHWGFTHLGRFAATYRSTFSESPSETMRAASPPRR